MTHRIAVSLLLLMGLTHAHAQSNRTLELAPFAPLADQDFLILIQDEWLDGCLGTVEMSITAEKIAIFARAANPPPGVGCTDAPVPFRRIFNPRAAAPGFDFGEALFVEYFFDAGDGPELRSGYAGNFRTDSAGTFPVQTGSWVTPGIASSGLFIDQQRDIMTALLADYDEDGKAVWFYGAGRVTGSAFSAPLQRFDEVDCVTEPCERVAAGETGRIDIVMRGFDEIVVAVDGLPLSARIDQTEARVYQRLPFSRDAALAATPPELPDLTGRWLVGIRSDLGRPEDYRPYDIAFDRVGRIDDRTGYFFLAREVGGMEEPRTFELICVEAEGLSAPGSCVIADYVDDGPNRCTLVDVNWRRVGIERAHGQASCNSNFILESVFDMFRVAFPANDPGSRR
ncbi:MAG: hypothetical protein AAGE01_00360 [Pseudomonadota bacterium]